MDAPKYRAMNAAPLKALPRKAPGLTQGETFAAVTPHLPETLFPGRARSESWTKCIQIDLEARGALALEKTKPRRSDRTG